MSVNPAEILLSPYPLGDLKLKNRIVMAPLTRTRVKSSGLRGELTRPTQLTLPTCGRR